MAPYTSRPRGRAPTPRERVTTLGWRILDTLAALHAAEARLTEAEATLLVRLKEQRRFEALGHVRFSDFTRECLKLHPRTARRRIALHAILGECPSVRDAFRIGRISVSQILALRPVLSEETAPYWIPLAGRLPVRELRMRVREARVRENVVPPGSEPDPDQDEQRDDSDRLPVTFLSPRSAGYAFEHGLETARRVLGWEAPRDRCLDALLSEADSSLPAFAGNSGPALPVESAGVPSVTPAPARPSVPPCHGEIRWSKGESRRARRALSAAARRLATVHRLGLPLPTTSVPATSALADRFLAIQRIRNPIRILEARLVYSFYALGAARALESRDDPVCSRVLGISERGLRNLFVAGFGFDRSPALADAFARGAIGFTQVLTLSQGVGTHTRAWIRRAQQVSFRQFQREVRLNRFDEYVFGMGVSIFPIEDLESRLRGRLLKLGWSPTALERELADRGLAVRPGASRDPAENPVLMKRLQQLTELVALELSRDEDPPRPRKLLSVPGRHLRVTVWTEPPVFDHWRRAHENITGHCGWLPDWAIAVLLVQAALQEWERLDPRRRPGDHKILERDDYRCQVPGCTARRALEIHHIRFRSAGGTDAPGNLITLCHAHHHHAIHRGTLRLRGRAPDDLIWEIGCSRSAPPRWIYRGEKLVA